VVAGLLLGIVLLAVVLIAVVAAARARPGQGFERIVRCRAGHLFTTTLVPGASLKAVRLWNVRFERCPVGRHWTIVAPVDESTLTPAEREAARSHHDVRIP
jgi:hypothetical protein